MIMVAASLSPQPRLTSLLMKCDSLEHVVKLDDTISGNSSEPFVAGSWDLFAKGRIDLGGHTLTGTFFTGDLWMTLVYDFSLAIIRTETLEVNMPGKCSDLITYHNSL